MEVLEELPPIQQSTADAGTTVRHRHGVNLVPNCKRDYQMGTGYAAGTSSSAAKSERRVARRHLPAAASLDDSHRVGPQRRRRMWRYNSGGTDAGELSTVQKSRSNRRIPKAGRRAASEPLPRASSSEEYSSEPSSKVPGRVARRRDHGRRMVGAMMGALEEVDRLDKTVSREERRRRKNHPRRLSLDLKQTSSWDDNTSLGASRNDPAEETAAEEKNRRARHHDAVSRLARSAELQHTSRWSGGGGGGGGGVPRTSVPMELLFSANPQTSADILDKAKAIRDREERADRLAAKISGSPERSRKGVGGGVAPRFPGDRRGAVLPRVLRQ